MSNTMKTIDELMEGLARYNCNAFTKDQLPNEMPPHIFKQALSTMLGEILGEPKAWDVSGDDYGFKDQGKNELLGEQRQRAADRGVKLKSKEK